MFYWMFQPTILIHDDNLEQLMDSRKKIVYLKIQSRGVGLQNRCTLLDYSFVGN